MERASRKPAGSGARRKRFVAVLVPAVIALLVAGCASSSSAGAAKSSTSKGCGSATDAPAGADLAFYCHKTITFIVDDAPGSDNDREMQALKPGVEKYLGATIKPVYYPGASVVGENKTTTAKNDGSTIGEASIKSSASYIFAGKNVLAFDPEKISYVWVTPPVNYAIVACKGSPYKTLEDLVNGKAQVTDVDIPSYLLTRLFFAAYDINVKYISGYSGSDLPAACQRGDGQVASAPPESFLTSALNAMVPGETPLMLTAPVDPASSLAFLTNSSAVQMSDFVKAHPVTGAKESQALQLMLDFYGPSGHAGWHRRAARNPHRAAGSPPGSVQVRRGRQC